MGRGHRRPPPVPQEAGHIERYLAGGRPRRPEHDWRVRRLPHPQAPPIQAVAQESRLPNIRFHDLRHTCATLLLAKGVHSKIVSEMLGHSSVSITLDVYSHVISGLGKAEAKAMDDLLS